MLARHIMAMLICLAAGSTIAYGQDSRDFGLGLSVGVIGKALMDPSGRVIRSDREMQRFLGAVSERENVKAVQKALAAFGFDPGTADGQVGSKTRDAVKRFQESIGHDATGILDDDETRILMVAYTAELERSSGTAPAVPTSATSNNGDTSTAVSSDVGVIRASRLFAGPEDYPPTDFAAYGILAFKTQASSHDRERHRMICDAYVSSIRSYDALPTPKQRQMVTVWPVSSSSIAAQLTKAAPGDVCDVAVDNYGSVMADQALRQAKAAGAPLKGLGPYL